MTLYPLIWGIIDPLLCFFGVPLLWITPILENPLPQNWLSFADPFVEPTRQPPTCFQQVSRCDSDIPSHGLNICSKTCGGSLSKALFFGGGWHWEVPLDSTKMTHHRQENLDLPDPISSTGPRCHHRLWWCQRGARLEGIAQAAWGVGREGDSKQVDSKFFPPKETRTTTSMHSRYIQCFFHVWFVSSSFGNWQLDPASLKLHVFFLTFGNAWGMIALKKRWYLRQVSLSEVVKDVNCSVWVVKDFEIWTELSFLWQR